MSLNLNAELNKKSIYSTANIAKFVIYSLLGIFLFFVPVKIGNSSSIMVDHIIAFINRTVPFFGPIFTVCIAIVGGLYPWYKGTYKKDIAAFILSVFGLIGIPMAFLGALSFMKIATIGPQWLMRPDMLPFVFEKVVMAVTMIVPIGSVFLTFIISYGLLEFAGVLMRPIMRPVFRTPGRSAIDAVASFVGSFSVAIYLTNRLYLEGKYTRREAITIMSGFSTVSATFMIIIARTLKIMDLWNVYFWSALAITFIVTALTVRLWPLSKIEDTYVDGKGKPEMVKEGSIFSQAIEEGLTAAATSKPLFANLYDSFKSGIKMVLILTPCMASVATFAFVLIKLTSFFDIFGYLFLPFTYALSLIGLPEPAILAKACATSLADVFAPPLYLASLNDVPLIVKFVTSVVAVSSIIFFGGSIPCLLSTDVNFKLWQMIVIWFERAVLALILTGVLAVILF
ncbi:nucleoside recognition GATE domain-containing membrane protein YjiH [Caldanaerovirga acetigignens]|uniref:Nucleoside recognition GATE domain-containing membrane protein YjiH n=1 Tax=Caldanaerovirga acetigignens TaxID=447595 RepID=A0A1M7MES6_9FIRM|nr:YjiH family protein [Caldanaerovirga acetigignens]SHM89352.1 nucleoside recognition GATE domain-containing membrane protein YjiH [Caldanaerovirga acetigignens]